MIQQSKAIPLQYPESVEKREELSEQRYQSDFLVAQRNISAGANVRVTWSSSRVNNWVGIISLVNPYSKKKMSNFGINSLHDVLMPLDDNYTIFMRSLYECVVVGCSSIWVIGPSSYVKQLQKLYGNWVFRVGSIEHLLDAGKKTEAVSTNEPKKKRPPSPEDRVPIMYITPPGGVSSRSGGNIWASAATSYVYAAAMSDFVMYQSTREMVASHFYVTNPWALCDLEEIKSFRSIYNNAPKEMAFEWPTVPIVTRTPAGRTIMDGEISSGLIPRALMKRPRAFRYNNRIEVNLLKLEEERKLIFGDLNKESSIIYIDVEWYRTLQSFRDYMNVLGESKLLRPTYLSLSKISYRTKRVTNA